jgi:hypothetical protein
VRGKQHKKSDNAKKNDSAKKEMQEKQHSKPTTVTTTT